MNQSKSGAGEGWSSAGVSSKCDRERYCLSSSSKKSKDWWGNCLNWQCCTFLESLGLQLLWPDWRKGTSCHAFQELINALSSPFYTARSIRAFWAAVKLQFTSLWALSASKAVGDMTGSLMNAILKMPEWRYDNPAVILVLQIWALMAPITKEGRANSCNGPSWEENLEVDWFTTTITVMSFCFS